MSAIHRATKFVGVEFINDKLLSVTAVCIMFRLTFLRHYLQLSNKHLAEFSKSK